MPYLSIGRNRFGLATRLGKVRKDADPIIDLRQVRFRLTPLFTNWTIIASDLAGGGTPAIQRRPHHFQDAPCVSLPLFPGARHATSRYGPLPETVCRGTWITGGASWQPWRGALPDNFGARQFRGQTISGPDNFGARQFRGQTNSGPDKFGPRQIRGYSAPWSKGLCHADFTCCDTDCCRAPCRN